MGLDTVELIMAIEEEFDIEIPDEDAEQLVTVGGIHQYVCKKLEERGPNPNLDADGRQACLTAETFYRVRAALTDLGHARAEITPRTRLDLLIPSPDPRKEWLALERKLELVLPALERPQWLKRAVMGMVVLSFVLA